MSISGQYLRHPALLIHLQMRNPLSDCLNGFLFYWKSKALFPEEISELISSYENKLSFACIIKIQKIAENQRTRGRQYRLLFTEVPVPQFKIRRAFIARAYKKRNPCIRANCISFCMKVSRLLLLLLSFFFLITKILDSNQQFCWTYYSQMTSSHSSEPVV